MFQGRFDEVLLATLVYCFENFHDDLTLLLDWEHVASHISVTEPEKDTGNRLIERLGWVIRCIKTKAWRLEQAVSNRGQIDLKVEVVHVVPLVDDLNVLTCFIKELNLETINNIVQVDLCPKLWQLGLPRVFEAHYRVEDKTVLVHDQVAHYLAFTCAQINCNK